MNHRNILTIAAAFFTVLSACIEVNDSKDESTKPVIDKMTAFPASLMINDTSVITVEARDLNSERLSYVWYKPDGGEWAGNVTGSSVTWKAPSSIGALSAKDFRIIVRVQNENKKYAFDTVTVTVNSTQNPVVTITSPSNGEYILLNTGTVPISATSTFPDCFMKCYINSVLIDSSTERLQNYNYNWNISSETEGTKQIQIVATRPGGYTGSATVTISLEGTIGKRK